VARIAKEAVYRLTETDDPEVVLGVGETSLATGMGGNSPIAADNKNMQLLQKLREQEASLKVQMAAEQVRYGAKNPACKRFATRLNRWTLRFARSCNVSTKIAKTDLALAKANEDAIRKSVNDQQRGSRCPGQ